MKVYFKNTKNGRKNYFLFFFALLISNFSIGQYTSGPSNFWSELRYGGEIGLGFTNGGFNASISPSAIYPVSNEFAAGVSLNFNYAKFNEDKFLAYGGSLLSLYNPIPQLQLSVELEQLRINRTFSGFTEDIEENYWSPALFLGLGYTTRNVTVGLRYNVLYDENDSIYADGLLPFVRFYF